MFVINLWYSLADIWVRGPRHARNVTINFAKNLTPQPWLWFMWNDCGKSLWDSLFAKANAQIRFKRRSHRRSRDISSFNTKTRRYVSMCECFFVAILWWLRAIFMNADSLGAHIVLKHVWCVNVTPCIYKTFLLCFFFGGFGFVYLLRLKSLAQNSSHRHMLNWSIFFIRLHCHCHIVC